MRKKLYVLTLLDIYLADILNHIGVVMIKLSSSAAYRANIKLYEISVGSFFCSIFIPQETEYNVSLDIINISC